MPRIRCTIAGLSSQLLLFAFVVACRDGGGPGKVPAAVAPTAATVPTGEVGTLLVSPPTFVVRDAAGEAISGVAVSIVVGEGGGTIRNAPTRSQQGATRVGDWTLGTRAGRNTLVVTVGKLSPLVLEATATPGAPVALRVAGGNDQVALAGDELPSTIGVVVLDRFDNPVPGQVVSFSPVDGGGTIEPTTVTSGSDGVAGGVHWRLGAQTSQQSVRASLGAFATAVVARVTSDFAIDVRFTGVEPSPDFQASFRRAADRIRTAVIGDLPDVAVQGLNVSACGNGVTGTLTETIDDIIIFASVTPIDGVGKVLARAGPCFLRNTTLQALVGTMQFDEADAQGLLNSGRFEAVVMHEMLHIVGIGSLWRLRNLVDSLGTTDPRYVGAVGVARCALIGFGSQCTTGVPVENTGGSGTAGVHWRESIFDKELMTGFAEATPDMPFSVLSVGSLADHGYTVNEKASDPFEFVATLGGARVHARTTAPPAASWEEVLEPRFEVSPFGFVTPVRPPPLSVLK